MWRIGRSLSYARLYYTSYRYAAGAIRRGAPTLAVWPGIYAASVTVKFARKIL
jgi:hypothetical protein